MRKSTLLWLVLAAFCGTALFHTSQKVHDEREKLGSLDVSISKEEESLRVLNAEWSYLNQPARLEKLVKTYLNMAPLKGSQFIKVEDVPLRTAIPETTAAAPLVHEEKTPEEKNITRPKVVVTVQQVVVKLRKPLTPAFLQKPARKPPADTASARSFNDVMKNLQAGVEQ